MLHEDLQADVVREDRLARTRARGSAVHACRHMCRRRVELREQETRLRAALIADDVPWDREPIDQEVLYTHRRRYISNM